MSVRERLENAGLALPQPASALGDYVPAVLSGRLVFTSGQLPFVDGELVAVGRVDDAVAEDIAAECARIAVLNALAAASSVCDLDEVVHVVKLTGYVASGAGFTRQPVVLNAASQVLAIAYGDSGTHAREAIGVAALPLGAPVEVSLVLEIDR